MNHSILEIVQYTGLLWAGLVIFAAYFVYGISGFGASIIAVPFLVQIYPLKTVIPVMVIIDLFAGLYLGKKSFKSADKKELLWLFPFTILGMFIGLYLLIYADSRYLLTLLGIFALGAGIKFLIEKKGVAPTIINRWWAFPFGIAGGIFTALFATGGVIYASYLAMRLKNPALLRSTMAFAILILVLLRSASMLATELLFQIQVLVIGGLLLIPMALGLWLGNQLHHKMNSQYLKKVYGLIIVYAGLMLLVKTYLNFS